ncbi:MAG: hypothetical protein NC110_00700 [Ruminococcus sp.]|nr:hypothetical protein [Ruminococcus sp.]
MKKVISVLLAMLCLLSVFTCSISALSLTEEEEESTLYGITYQKETLENVKMIYKPNPSLRFDRPGYVTVTKDTPIAINHDFICWKDENGKLYYEGDKVYVDGEVTLYAVWGEKKDNDPYLLRLLRAVTLTFQRIMLKAFGIFKDVQDFDKEYVAPTTVEETTTAIWLGEEV